MQELLQNELLQNVVNIGESNLEKYPELGEFLGRIRFFEQSLKEMKYNITIPVCADEWIKDVDLENQLLGFVLNKKWNLAADIFLQIPLKEYHELSNFLMKLFEVVTEGKDNAEDNLVEPDEFFVQFLKEIRNKRSKIEFLPVQKEVFAQLAATLILHLSFTSSHQKALPIVLESYKNSQLEPCLYHTFFDPDADSPAIKSRQEPIKVRAYFNFLTASYR